MEDKNNEIYDENNKLNYTKEGDYYYPNIILDDSKKVHLGKYGMLRLEYLKEYKRGMWTELMMKGKLRNYLQEIDKIAHNRVEEIIKDFVKEDNFMLHYDGSIEQLEWIGCMNNYKRMAEEIVYKEIIYC